MFTLTHLQIRNPKDDETPIEAGTQIFASLLPHPYIPLWKRWIIQPKTYAFEIYLISQTIYLYASVPKSTETFVSSLISSSFPTSTVKKTSDPMDLIFKSKRLSFGEVALNSYTYLPTKTYFDFKDVDPLSSLLGFMSKQPNNLKMAIQIVITPAYFPWADNAVAAAHKLSYDETAAKYGQNPQRQLIMKKASFQGGKTAIRLLVGTTDNTDPYPYLTQLAGTFGSFSLGEGNQYVFKRKIFFQDWFLKRIRERKISYFENQYQILNAQELATIWHPPGYLLAGIKNIAWGKTLLGEPPENLPVVPESDTLRQSFDKLRMTYFDKLRMKSGATLRQAQGDKKERQSHGDTLRQAQGDKKERQSHGDTLRQAQGDTNVMVSPTNHVMASQPQSEASVMVSPTNHVMASQPQSEASVMVSSTNHDIKQDINFFAKTEFKNKEQIFGIKTEDRRKHVYIIGKTGVGKSTLIANMAIDDIRKDRGIGIIDPHGDLSETILDYIPKRRLNDVVYLEPFDMERPFSLNVLEVKNKQQKDLVASGIVSIFYKLYKDSWGPRLEYILRNVILTLLEAPGATLVDILALLSNPSYRKKVVSSLQDPVLKNFWEKEYAKMPDRLKAEAISPIQNKVGQFVTSKMIRNIIGKTKSSIDLENIMNEGKILILNLSQGKLGEDNTALLGAMLITQLQLAAMNRSFIKETERKDFFLYVDEFQNFATHSFIKILSEARKYRLSLTLANQYIEQLDEEIQRAIFGNVGTLISFVVGSRDAYVLSKEYGEIYTENDLVSLGKYEVVMKLSIDGMTSSPFPATTLPLPALKNDNREKIIRLSKEKYGRKV